MSIAASNLAFGIGQRNLGRLNAIFAAHPAVLRVLLYGSRAKGNFRAGSDIDLCLDAPDMSWQELLAIDTEIDDLLMPWKVDLAHQQKLESSALLADIQRVGVQVYPGSAP